MPPPIIRERINRVFILREVDFTEVVPFGFSLEESIVSFIASLLAIERSEIIIGFYE
jgi:hypothetical protein